MRRALLLLLLLIVAAAPPASRYAALWPANQDKPEITGSVRNTGAPQLLPKGGGFYRVGEPYVIAGRTYVPREDPNYRAEGIASWYGDYFHGRLTANGERYNMHALSAAHPTLPLPSYVRVTNLDNNLSLVVRVNDRGPFLDGRIIDMSVKAAKLLGFYERGLARVRVEYLGPARLEGSDDTRLAATLRYERPQQSELMSASLGQAASFEQTGSVTSPELVTRLETQDRRADTSVPADSGDDFPSVIFD